MNLTSRAARRAAVVAAAACAALAVPAAIALAAPSAAVRTAAAVSPAAPMCQTPGLVEWINTNGSDSGGGVVHTLNFTNLSGHACTLNGIPYLYAVNLKGQRVGNVAKQNGHNTPTITIKNGSTATSQLTIRLPKSACHSVTAAGLDVFPPNQQRAKVIPFPFKACSATGAGQTFLFVTQVK